MDLRLFQDSPTGALVPISGSTPGHGAWEHMAFVPHPLRDTSPDLSGAAYRAVARARAALASLDATARRLPNPRLFRGATLRLEAQSTAALEGTYEPLDQVLSVDEDDAQDATMREVLNYLRVAESAFEWAAQGRFLTVSSVGELQRQLLLGTSGERDFAGVRPIQVVIGRREGLSASVLPIHAARYVPPPPGPDLEARVSDLLGWMQTDHSEAIDPVVAAAMSHYEFEALHPFHDGNGRIGRLLIVLSLQGAGLLSEPSMTVSPWFESRRSQYDDLLLGVSTTGDWSSWVAFFAEGLAFSADSTCARMLALTDVQHELAHIVRGSSLRTANAGRLVEFAVGNPSFTVAQAAESLGMGVQGAGKLVQSLVDLQVLAPYPAPVRGRRYYAPRVLEVLLGRSG